MKCPRLQGSPMEDHDWEWCGDGTCQACGSVSPRVFIEYVESGGEVGPTDKDYKVYLNGLRGKVKGAPKFYFQHLFVDGVNQAVIDKFVSLLNDGKVNIGEPGRFYVMPFFLQNVKPESATPGDI